MLEPWADALPAAPPRLRLPLLVVTPPAVWPLLSAGAGAPPALLPSPLPSLLAGSAASGDEAISAAAAVAVAIAAGAAAAGAALQAACAQRA